MAGFSEVVPDGERCIVVLAGPNGAGKSTFFEQYLAASPLPFVNADRIARTLKTDDAGSYAYAAAAAAQQVRASLVAQGVSFCMETVFSDPDGDKVAFLREARGSGYVVVLVFIGLAGPELCLGRVLQRVAEGGHDVPDAKLRARYGRSLTNLRAALAFVDHAYLFDNSSCDEPYRLVARYREGALERECSPLPPWAEGLPGLGGKGHRPRRTPSARRGQRARRGGGAL